MKLNLETLLTSVNSLERINTKLYRATDLRDELEKMSDEKMQVSDTIITPYYICDLGILELYDFELNIRVVDSPNADNFILTKTGRKSLDKVDPQIEHKLRQCYLELINPEKWISAQSILEFVNYVLNSHEIKERVIDCLNEYTADKIYFEVY